MTLSDGSTINFNSAASVFVEDAAEMQIAIYPNTDAQVLITLSNGNVYNMAVSMDGTVEANYEKGQNDVTASIGSWSSGSAKVTLSNPNQTSYYVNMPNLASWDRGVGILGETVTCTVGGKTYTHFFNN